MSLACSIQMIFLSMLSCTIASQGGFNKVAVANLHWLHFLNNRSSIQSLFFQISGKGKMRFNVVRGEQKMCQVRGLGLMLFNLGEVGWSLSLFSRSRKQTTTAIGVWGEQQLYWLSRDQVLLSIAWGRGILSYCAFPLSRYSYFHLTSWSLGGRESVENLILSPLDIISTSH